MTWLLPTLLAVVAFALIFWFRYEVRNAPLRDEDEELGIDYLGRKRL